MNTDIDKPNPSESDLAAGFPPFAPPADFEFEPELQGPPPRPIPGYVRLGRYAQKQSRPVWFCWMLGATCLLLAVVPFIKQAGNFLLPLQYLAHVGYGLVGFGLLGFIAGILRTGSRQYLREGIPIPARILKIVTCPASIVDPDSAGYVYTASIEYQHPETRKLETATVTSNPVSPSEKGCFALSFDVGDYVTAIYLPDEFPKSLQLYGFLDLNPHIGVVLNGPRPFVPLHLRKAVRNVATVISIPSSLLIAVYMLTRYVPIDHDFGSGIIPLVIGTFSIGAAIFYWAERYEWRRKRRRPNIKRVAPRPLVFLGACLFGGVITLAFLFGLNGWLDDSPAKLQVVDIKECTIRTYGANGVPLMRTYEICYSLPNAQSINEFSTSPDHLDDFAVPGGQIPLGMAEIHDGFFGWPWVKDIRPLILPPGNPGQQPQPDPAIQPANPAGEL